MEKLQITPARELLLKTLKEYNSEVTQVYWFKFTNRETDLFVEMMEKYSNEQNGELLRQNREMREALERIIELANDKYELATTRLALIDARCENCLTSCNKGNK